MSASLEDLIHDVSSKCSSLKGAASILRGASSKEKRELLALMAEEARGLARQISEFERQSGDQ